MPVPSAITDLSTTAGNNSPSGSDAVYPDLDNYLRVIQGFIAENYTNKAPKANPTFTGVCQFAAGSAAAPSITYSSDTSSGLFFSASVIGATIDGAEVARWTSTGYGVGVTPSVKWHTKSTGEIVRIETTTARGSGAAYLTFRDPTGRKGYIGYSSSDGLELVNDLGGFTIWTNGSARAILGSDGVLQFNDATAPSGTPSGGGYIYVESGALKYKGSSGTVTTLGAA